MNLNEFQSMSRGLQIWADVQRRRPKQWVALDDQGFNWPAWCRENLIQTDDELRLHTPAVLARLNVILSTQAFQFPAKGHLPKHRLLKKVRVWN